MFRKIIQWLSVISLLVVACLVVYSQNLFNLRGRIVRHENETAQVKPTGKLISEKNRNIIRKLLMKQTHADEGLTKQGFVNVPAVGILQPIFNDAYSTKGLNAGANYANRSEVDPTGSKVPVMGQGNYGLASHNFNDGKTGFSALQETLNQDAPYLVDGKLGIDGWLNGQPVYLANENHIYRYSITNQKLVRKGEISVLNPTATPELTIISCLFPSTEYRIITKASLTKTWTWHNAPANVVNGLDLRIQKTNAHANWFNPGEEEGVN